MLIITFCFTTISIKKLSNTFMSLKDLTSSNSYFRDQNLCFSLRKLLCLFFCLFVCFILFMTITCLHVSPWWLWFKFSFFSFSAKHSQSTKPPFLLGARHDIPCPNWINKDEFIPWLILHQCNFSSSYQLDISFFWSSSHYCYISLNFFIFRSDRDNSNGKLFSCK